METDKINSSEHLSEGTLSLLLKEELTPEQRTATKLHLSYCFVCRGQRDELVLKRSAQRMWETFSSAHHDEEHIDDHTFQSFWSGDLRDDARLTEISRHCIACAECRQRREWVRSNTHREREFVLKTVLLAGFSMAWKRRRFLIVVSLGLLTAVVLRYALNRPRPQPVDTSVAEQKPPASTYRADQPHGVDQPNDYRPKETPTPHHDERVNRSNLIASAQTIDLRTIPDGAESRSPDEVGREANRGLPILTPDAGATHFRIQLPANSRRGTYLVSIREPAFLQEIVPAKVRSRDGRSLSVSMNLTDLEEKTYILRLERLLGGSSHKEYIGDYEVVITKRSSKKVPVRNP